MVYELYKLLYTYQHTNIMWTRNLYLLFILKVRKGFLRYILSSSKRSNISDNIVLTSSPVPSPFFLNMIWFKNHFPFNLLLSFRKWHIKTMDIKYNSKYYDPSIKTGKHNVGGHPWVNLLGNQNVFIISDND